MAWRAAACKWRNHTSILHQLGCHAIERSVEQKRGINNMVTKNSKDASRRATTACPIDSVVTQSMRLWSTSRKRREADLGIVNEPAVGLARVIPEIRRICRTNGKMIGTKNIACADRQGCSKTESANKLGQTSPDA